MSFIQEDPRSPSAVWPTPAHPPQNSLSSSSDPFHLWNLRSDQKNCHPLRSTKASPVTEYNPLNEHNECHTPHYLISFSRTQKYWSKTSGDCLPLQSLGHIQRIQLCCVLRFNLVFRRRCDIMKGCINDIPVQQWGRSINKKKHQGHNHYCIILIIFMCFHSRHLYRQ